MIQIVLKRLYYIASEGVFISPDTLIALIKNPHRPNTEIVCRNLNTSDPISMSAVNLPYP